MQLLRFFIIVLLDFSTVCAMELTTVPTAIGICQLGDELIIMEICSRLDRSSRDVLRLTNKKYFTVLFSQDVLNKKYQAACITRNKIDQDFWQKRGGWLPYQEFARAIQSEQYRLATWLLKKKKAEVWDVYCGNIKEAVETSTVDKMVPVIEWLLNTRKPITCNGEFLSGYHFANNLKEQYPDVQKFIVLFKKYEQEEKERKEKENRERIISFGRGVQEVISIEWDSLFRIEWDSLFR